MPQQRRGQEVKLTQYQIQITQTIREAVRVMDEGEMALCLCVDKTGKLKGIMTDGDFRRAVHHGIQLDETVDRIMNTDFVFVSSDYTPAQVSEIFANTIIQQIPVLKQGKVVDILQARDFQLNEGQKTSQHLDLPVVIMAGGKGTRLDPFTRILPKPLIPLGNDPVIKIIMDQFHQFGLNHFYISVNDKERMVRAYFHDHDLGYRIDYIQEELPLGTAGALNALKGKMRTPFFVSNCDIIIKTDLAAFYDFHLKGNYALSLIGAMRQMTVPYGVCEVDRAGHLKRLTEKPQYDFLVNTGLYLLNPSVLKYIPKKQMFHMTDVMRVLQENKQAIGIFPVSEKSWMDVGQLAEYKKMVQELTVMPHGE